MCRPKGTPTPPHLSKSATRQTTFEGHSDSNRRAPPVRFCAGRHASLLVARRRFARACFSGSGKPIFFSSSSDHPALTADAECLRIFALSGADRIGVLTFEFGDTFGRGCTFVDERLPHNCERSHSFYASILSGSSTVYSFFYGEFLLACRHRTDAAHPVSGCQSIPSHTCESSETCLRRSKLYKQVPCLA